MADGKTVDIDGSQWSMKDQEARHKIATIENNQIPIALEDTPITLKSGYTALYAKFFRHQKVGKIHFATVSIENIKGEHMIFKEDNEPLFTHKLGTSDKIFEELKQRRKL